jgi:hypothetical protein
MGKKIFKVVSSALLSLILIVLYIKLFAENKAIYNDGYGTNYEANEELVYFFYASVSFLVCSIIDLISYSKYGKENEFSINLAPAMSSLFLIGYFTKAFFKPLMKKNIFNEVYFVVFLTILIVTIIAIWNFIEYLIKQHKNNN